MKTKQNPNPSIIRYAMKEGRKFEEKSDLENAAGFYEVAIFEAEKLGNHQLAYRLCKRINMPYLNHKVNVSQMAKKRRKEIPQETLAGDLKDITIYKHILEDSLNEISRKN